LYGALKMRKTSRTATNRTLFALLVATVVIPLPAMTPALLSSAMGAMTLMAAPPPPATFVPVYFIPTRPQRGPKLVPETVLVGITEPRTVISETVVDEALPFDDVRPPTFVSFTPPHMPTPWHWLVGGPRSGGGGAFATTPVPEPATWAMLITGFILSGVFIRRRRAVPVARVRSA